VQIDISDQELGRTRSWSVEDEFIVKTARRMEFIRRVNGGGGDEVLFMHPHLSATD
jgi:hypothetical protein